MNKKLIKCSFGLVAVLSLGLSGCYMDTYNPSMDYNTAQSATNQTKQSAQNSAKKVSQSSTPTDTVQKSTPGPKRKAAPQLPVIQ